MLPSFLHFMLLSPRLPQPGTNDVTAIAATRDWLLCKTAGIAIPFVWFPAPLSVTLIS